MNSGAFTHHERVEKAYARKNNSLNSRAELIFFRAKFFRGLLYTHTMPSKHRSGGRKRHSKKAAEGGKRKSRRSRRSRKSRR